jgi:dTDP-4-dehydrorhamnose 3,5-epimerase
VRFTQTPLTGSFHVESEPNQDLRGSFTRIWCEREFGSQGLGATFVQASISRNARRGTVRGMHMQLAPSCEAKLVRCIRGSIYDVIVDLRPESSTYMQYFGIELSSERQNALYVAPRTLHGFQTLADDCDVLYEMTDFHAPTLAFAARWNDPAFAIRWPIESQVVILPRDAQYPDFDSAAYLGLARGFLSLR